MKGQGEFSHQPKGYVGIIPSGGCEKVFVEREG